MQPSFYLVIVNRFNYYCRNEAAVEACLGRHNIAKAKANVRAFTPREGVQAAKFEVVNYDR